MTSHPFPPRWFFLLFFSLVLSIAQAGDYGDEDIFGGPPAEDGSRLSMIRNLAKTAGAKIDKAEARSLDELANVSGVKVNDEKVLITNDFVGEDGGWLQNYNLEGRFLDWQRQESCLIRNCFFGEGDDGWISSDGITGGGGAYIYLRKPVKDIEIRNNTIVGRGDYRGKGYGIQIFKPSETLVVSENHLTGLPGDQMVFYGTTREPALIERNYHRARGSWQSDRLDWDPNATYSKGDLVAVPKNYIWPAGNKNGGGEKLIVAKKDGVGGDASLPPSWTKSNENWLAPDPHNDGYNPRGSEAGIIFRDNMIDFAFVNAPFWMGPIKGNPIAFKDIVIDGCVMINRGSYKGIAWNPGKSEDFNGLKISDCWFWIENDNFLMGSADGVTHQVSNLYDLKTNQPITDLPEGYQWADEMPPADSANEDQ